jgi:putative peptidoglycan lipid II flippase
LLFVFLKKQKIYLPQPGWLAFALKVAAAVAVMTAVLWLAMGPATAWLQAGWHWKLGMLAGLVLVGVAVYGGCLFVFGFRLRHFSIRGAE